MPFWTQKRNTNTGGVTSIIAGTNITISPSGGTGDVTINSTGGGSPASPSGSIQYNNSGVFGGSANATLDATGKITQNIANDSFAIQINSADGSLPKIDMGNGIGDAGFLQLYDNAGNVVTNIENGTVTSTSFSGSGASLTGVLILDQTTPQNIINGAPIFDSGLEVGTTGSLGVSGTANAVINSDGRIDIGTTGSINIANDQSIPSSITISNPFSGLSTMDIGVTGGVNRDIGAINFYGQNDTTDNYIGIFSYYDRNNYPQFTFRSVYDVNVGQGFLEFIAYQVNSGLRVLETGAVITTSFGSTRNTLDDGDGGASFAGGNVGIDSSGNLTASGSIKGGGFNSSDGSAGITGTFTTASLVGKTVTFKNGLITGFA